MARFLGGPRVQYFKTGTSDFLDGGLLYSYAGGTLTPKNTYPTIADALALTNANANPVVLDSRGEAAVVISGSTKLILKDAAGATIWTTDAVESASSDILDSNGNEILKFVGVASAVNEFTMTNAATTNKPILASTGDDTNVGMSITSKGSGTLLIDAGATGTVDIGTTSTGAINLRRATAVTGALTTTTSITASTSITATTALNIAATASTNFLPVGMVIWSAITAVPQGWLECDGSAISRTTYSALFGSISTSYGAGDGLTTFNLPDQARRTLVGRGGSGTAVLAATIGSTGGAETHQLTIAEMPNHAHVSGAAASQNSRSYTAGGSVDAAITGGTTATTGGDGSHNTMQPSLVLIMLIRIY